MGQNLYQPQQFHTLHMARHQQPNHHAQGQPRRPEIRIPTWPA